MPVRPVPSLKPRDPAVDPPDYLLISRTRLEEILDFMSKRKALLGPGILAWSHCPFGPFPFTCASYPGPSRIFLSFRR
jgi:hypothetical protein